VCEPVSTENQRRGFLAQGWGYVLIALLAAYCSAVPGRWNIQCGSF
jgi:hypothetical protein